MQVMNCCCWIEWIMVMVGSLQAGGGGGGGCGCGAGA